MKFEIPFRLPSLNEYVRDCRTNKYKSAKIKSGIESDILWILKTQKITIDKPCYFIFEWHEKTYKRDKDNVAFAKKFIFDALQKSGILKNDNNKHILGFADPFVYDKTDRVVVHIVYDVEELIEILRR